MKRYSPKLNEQINRDLKNRQSYLIGNIKYKRISKKEISNPCDLKHIINICSSDRDSYYTLSKLLPATFTSNSYSSPQTSSNNDSSASLSSSLSSSSSIASSNKISKINKRHSANECKSKTSEQRAQLKSSSSISLSVSQPFKLIVDQVQVINNRVLLK
jgi:hypothetical protein